MPIRDVGSRIQYLWRQRLPHPSTLIVKLPRVFIGLRSTGLPSTVKEFVIHIVSARMANGLHSGSGCSKMGVDIVIKRVLITL
jgi:hypothetical protein